MTLPPPESTSTIKQYSRKALRYKRPNALIPKQKIENAMRRTFLKKNIYAKKCLWSETEVYTDSRSIKGDSEIIKIHPATLQLPLEGKLRAYVTACNKPVYVRGYSSPIRVYTRL